MKEIGGYLEIDKNTYNEYRVNCTSFNTASNALVCFLKNKKINKIYLPYFLCDSIVNKLKKNNIKYVYYHIDKRLYPIIDFKINKDEYIYMVNYYGQISNSKIKSYSLKYKNIIIDNVQSFFQKPIDGIPTIYSCRKYFGVPDGAYLFAKCNKQNEISIDKSYDRYKHLIGRLEEDGQSHYSEFKNNEELLENEGIKLMSVSTRLLLSNIDYKFVRKQRTLNYDVLNKYLEKYNNLKLRKQIGPYCYPLYIENGAIIRKELIKNKIYVPVLWPNVLNLDECIEKDFAQNILPIPCDQRYDEKDMKYVANIVIRLIKKYNK